VSRNGRELSLQDAAALLDRPAITGDAVTHYARHAAGRRALVWCCTRPHAEHVAEVFSAAGYPALAVDASHTDRAARIAAFRGGHIQILTSVDLLTTGYDDPALAAGIMLRYTESLTLYLQMVGRLLRPAPGKRDAILLDHVGNVLEHNLPDAAREWTLDGRPKRTTAAIRQCPQCYAVFAASLRCPACGYTLASQSDRHTRRPRPEQDGELVELSAERLDALRNANLRDLLRLARTREDLQLIAAARGYKAAWIHHVMTHRQRRSEAA
jgi:superfamily II DNA or RNA helicase